MIRASIFLLLFLSTLAFAQEHPHPPVVLGATVTAKDTIPDFAAAPTIWSVQSGAWSDPNTWWPARVPNASDVVKIDDPHVVTSGGLEAGVIGIEGALIHTGGRLKVGTLLNYRSGKWHVSGDSEVVIANRPLESNDPLKFGTGIISFGEVRITGTPKMGHIRVIREPRAGDTTLELSVVPQGWKAGDTLFLPDTRQTPVLYALSTAPPVPVAMRWEHPVIASISGNVVNLAAPLLYDHPAGPEGLLPHVANETRSIKIRSESPAGTRGHMLLTERASISIQNVEIRDMGRTTSMPLGPANQIGRYPVHFHHLMGPRNLSNTGYQYEFTGNSVLDSTKWGVVLHNSHWGNVSDNVVVGAQGSGIQTEQGNERENLIARNFIGKIGTTIQSHYAPTYGGVGGPGRPFANGFGDFGYEGSGIWTASGDNYIRDNVIANVAYTGINLNARGAAGFANHHPLVPKFRGADIAIPAEWDNYFTPVVKEAPPVRQMEGNEIYASTECMWVSFSTRGTIKDTTCWNPRQRALYHARNYDFTYENFTALADPVASNLNYSQNCGLCVESLAYASGLVRFTGFRVTGFNVGVVLPSIIFAQDTGGPDLTSLENGVLQNNVNITDYSGRRPKVATVKGVTFATNPYGPKKPVGATVPLDFRGILAGNGLGANIVLSSRLLIYGYGGQDVEFFFPEQAPGRIMPERVYGGVRSPLANCPSVGLTNQRCMDKHGVATLGRVATCSTAHGTGFLCPQ